MKWLLLDFQASVKANDQLFLQLVNDDGGGQSVNPAESVQLMVNETERAYLVDTGVTQFVISKHQFGLFDQVTHKNVALLAQASGPVLLVDEHGNSAIPVVSAMQIYDLGNSLRKKISVDGFFQNENDANLAGFNLKLTFYAGRQR